MAEGVVGGVAAAWFEAACDPAGGDGSGAYSGAAERAAVVERGYGAGGGAGDGPVGGCERGSLLGWFLVLCKQASCQEG